MKLPEDRNEKIKILVMIGLVGAAILYALVFFLIMPYFTKTRGDAIRLEELEQLVWRAERDIQQMTRNRDLNTSILKEILDISENRKFILHPNLGNYLLVAEGILHRTAAQENIEILSIRETSGPPRPPDANDRNQSAFWPYAVSLTLEVGLHELTRFVHRLQRENPYLAIVSLSVTAGTPSDPSRHNVNLTIQWPVWRSPDHPNRLAVELLADEERQ